MNTTPTISKESTAFYENLPTYTALGGSVTREISGISVVLLNRGSRPDMHSLFSMLEKEGFDYVVSIEKNSERYDIDRLVCEFPFVRFVFPKTEINPGVAINLGCLELKTKFFFVLWSDLSIIHANGAVKMRELLEYSKLFPKTARIMQMDGTEAPSVNPIKRLCTVPMLQDTDFQTKPTIVTPIFSEKSPETDLDNTSKDEYPTLFPFDYLGFYDRERFTAIGGFDGKYENHYWQLLDFGFRAWLCGEEIRCTQFVRLTAAANEQIQKKTTDEGFRRYFLKCLSPRFIEEKGKKNSQKNESAYRLPLRSFFQYLKICGFSVGFRLVEAWRQFKEIRTWVKENSAQFHIDAGDFPKYWMETIMNNQNNSISDAKAGIIA
jgi:hypothetical protein